MRRLLPLLAAVGASACGPEAADRGRSASALAREIDSARAEFDEVAFRSLRKDGQLVSQVTMEGRSLLSLTPPVPSSISFPVRVPDDALFRFTTGVPSLGGETLRSSIRFEVRVESDGEPALVFSDLLRRRAANRWRDHEVDLTPWAGKEVTIELSTRVENDPGAPGAALVAWGDPVVSGGPGEPGENDSPDRPTLVLVSIDCLRADHVGAYGYPLPTTPAIDALAREATVFENAFATASWTLPSHMSMLTGLVPSLHGATKWEKLSSGLDYLPELLGRSGYRASGVVSWVYLSQTYGFERGFDSYRVLDQPAAGDIVDLALSELHRGRGRPQFLFAHLWEPHWPYLPEPADLERMGGRPRDISSLHELIRDGKPAGDDLQREEMVRLYDAEIAVADREIGRLFDEMKAMGLWESSLVVITSDHGEAFLEHGHWQHSQTLYDELTRVPLVVKWPGQAEPAREGAPVSLVDLFVTFAEAAGVETEGAGGSGAIARRSLGAPPDEARIVLSEVTWRSPAGSYMKVALRDRGWKYIATLSGPPGDDLGVSEVEREEIYDLTRDPREHEDLSGKDVGPLNRFRAELRSFLETARTAQSMRRGEPVELDDETLEKLKSLGYTH
jgi:arylsulfatase A-like enzyme